MQLFLLLSILMTPILLFLSIVSFRITFKRYDENHHFQDVFGFEMIQLVGAIVLETAKQYSSNRGYIITLKSYSFFFGATSLAFLTLMWLVALGELQ